MSDKLTLEELIRFNTELKAIVKSRIPIDEGLQTLSKEMDGRLKFFIDDIAQRISRGESLSSALAQRDDLLEEYYVSLIQAGEASGNLEKVLNTLIRDYRKSLMVKRTISTAIRYPLTIFVIFSFIIVFILVFIIPHFNTLFNQLGTDIPGPAYYLYKISLYMTTHTLYLVVILVVAIAFLYQFSRSLYGKDFFDSLKLRAPFLGKMLYLDMISTFSRNLSNLLFQEIPIDTALLLIRGSMQYDFGKLLVDKVLEGVKKGKRISEAMADTALIPPSNVWMVRISEERGDLPDILSDIADYYEERYYNLRDNIIPYLEPVLIVSLGVLIGFVIVSLYYPLFVIPSLIGR